MSRNLNKVKEDNRTKGGQDKVKMRSRGVRNATPVKTEKETIRIRL